MNQPRISGTWVIAGTSILQPYPRWIAPAQRARALAAAREFWASEAAKALTPTTQASLYDGQLDLDWGDDDDA